MGWLGVRTRTLHEQLQSPVFQNTAARGSFWLT